MTTIKDYRQKLQSLDEQNPNWAKDNQDIDLKNGKIAAIVLLAVVIFGAVVYNRVEAHNAPVSCFSLVDQDGNE